MRFLLFFIMACLMFASPLLAAEPLIFKDSTADIRALSMLDLLKDKGNFDPSAPYRIADYDLNGDGVAEWLIEQPSEGCEARASCRFFIGGLSRREPVILGQFYAAKIAILDLKQDGITKIAAYTDPNDDYNYKTYAWKPDTRSFAPQ